MSIRNTLIRWLGGIDYVHHASIISTQQKTIAAKDRIIEELKLEHHKMKNDCVVYANRHLRATVGHIVKSSERGVIETDGKVCVTGRNALVQVVRGEILVAPWLKASIDYSDPNRAIIKT